MKQEEQLHRGRRRRELQDLFDKIFHDGVRSGLLVAKAAEKAAQAIGNIDEIDNIRTIAIDARMAVEFPVDQS